MEIHIQNEDINDGKELTLDVNMTPIRELPPTRGGLRRTADIVIATAMGSDAHKALSTVFSSPKEPYLRLRTKTHDGVWGIRQYIMPGIPSDGRVRFTLYNTGRRAL